MPEYKKTVDVAKSWKRQFFEVRDIEAGAPPKTIIRPGKHGLLKEKKNAH